MNPNLSLRTLAALALLAALIGSVVARADTVAGDNVRIGFRAWILPRALPRGDPSPVSLHLSGRVHPIGKQRPSALERVTIQINRHAVFTTRGLPRCPSPPGRNPLRGGDARCRAALIGSGRFRSHIDIPEQAPFPAIGRVLAFNRRLHGRRASGAPRLAGTDPVPTTMVLIARLTRSGPTPGRVRLRADDRDAADSAMTGAM